MSKSHTGVWIKDIVLKAHIISIYFQNTIKPVCAVITNFHASASHLGTAELKAAHKVLHTGPGLKAIGKTQFGTVILSSISVQLTIPAIKRVVQNGKFDFESTMDFEFNVAQLIDVGRPAVKALACLEHAMLQSIKDVITDPQHEFPNEVQQQIFGILNSQHWQLFEDGNLSNQVYLAATYLDFTYLKSDLFKSDNNDDSSYTGIHHVDTFKIVAQFLVDLTKKEIKLR
ncbi:hypothetical protein L208DRAFT_1379599 [Tricholoma matsutake]|nr:hypothetical protein L208DRAFT_1379599 [Tricholoma matsutake 945]